jgi:hypothetical protein
LTFLVAEVPSLQIITEHSEYKKRKRKRDKTFLPEAVLELPGDFLQVPHSTGTGGLSSLSLQAPVVRSELGGRVTALSTS